MTTQPSKLRKTYIIAEWSCGDLEGSLDRAIKILQEEKESAAKRGYTNLILVADKEYDYDSSREALQLYGDRLETDAEYAARIKRSQKAKETAKTRAKKAKEEEQAAELELYLKLKKKFEAKEKSDTANSSEAYYNK